VPGYSLLSAFVSAVVDAAVALGWVRGALVAEAGLDPALLADPDARVPYAHDLRLWTVLARRPAGGQHAGGPAGRGPPVRGAPVQGPPVGLALGERLGLAGLGVLGHAMGAHATAGDALAWLARYQAVLHPELVPRVAGRAGPRGPEVVFAYPANPDLAALREPVYAQAAANVAILRALTGRPAVAARAVAYPLPPPADPYHHDRAEYHDRHFGCRVAWNAPELTITFDAALLAVPLPRADPPLRGYLTRRADALRAALLDDCRDGGPDDGSDGRADGPPGGPPDVAAHVRQRIEAALAHGPPRLGAVARALAMSERTLHRRLAAEGTSFAALVSAARRARAARLLGDPRLSCSEVAVLLGYAEPAAFFRAFRRWTGLTPRAWRAAAARPSASA
jgi:AraC-like DNA-binding protein